MHGNMGSVQRCLRKFCDLCYIGGKAVFFVLSGFDFCFANFFVTEVLESWADISNTEH